MKRIWTITLMTVDRPRLRGNDEQMLYPDFDMAGLFMTEREAIEAVKALGRYPDLWKEYRYAIVEGVKTGLGEIAEKADFFELTIKGAHQCERPPAWTNVVGFGVTLI